MAKITLNNLGSPITSASITTINSNNDAVEVALENTLSLDGTSPNAMEASLDMNSNTILNLPDPLTDQEPATKSYVDTITESLTGANTGYLPVVHPSSGNIQGSGFPTEHQLVWADTNPIFNADAMYFTSDDPSALCSIPITNAGSAGDTIGLRFRWGSNDVTISHTVGTGDTTSTIAASLISGIQSNSTLFVPSNGTTNISGGGLPGLILYTTRLSNYIHFDYDSRQTVTLAKVTTGTVDCTLPQTHPTPLDKAWDSNPLSFWIRNVSGMAPPTNSNVFNLVVGSSSSGAPGTVSMQYGNAGVQVLSSTDGAISSRWQFYTPDVNGTINQGIHVGAGLYGASATGGDKGSDTANFNGLYVAGRSILSRDLSNAYKSANQSVTTLNAYVPVTFNSKSIDSANYSTSTSVFTAANTNYYEINAFVDILIGATQTFVALIIRKNGSVVSQINREASTGGINYTMDIRDILYLTAGDTIDIVVYTTQNLTITGGSAFSRFMVQELTR